MACGIVFHSTASPFPSEAPGIGEVEVVGAVNSAAELEGALLPCDMGEGQLAGEPRQIAKPPDCPHAGGMCCHGGRTPRQARGQRVAGVILALNPELTTHAFAAASQELQGSHQGMFWWPMAAACS